MNSQNNNRNRNIFLGIGVAALLGYLGYQNFKDDDQDNGEPEINPNPINPVIPNTPLFGTPLSQLQLRNDVRGAGHFGASRSNSSGQHNGIDLIATKGETVYSPIEGVMVRFSNPYASDPKFRGVLIRGTGIHQGYEMKIWYMIPSIVPNQIIVQGMPIGTAQAISEKHGANMLDHLHIQVTRNGKLIDPQSLFFG